MQQGVAAHPLVGAAAARLGLPAVPLGRQLPHAPGRRRARASRSRRSASSTAGPTAGCATRCTSGHLIFFAGLALVLGSWIAAAVFAFHVVVVRPARARGRGAPRGALRRAVSRLLPAREALDSRRAVTDARRRRRRVRARLERLLRGVQHPDRARHATGREDNGAFVSLLITAGIAGRAVGWRWASCAASSRSPGARSRGSRARASSPPSSAASSSTRPSQQLGAMRSSTMKRLNPVLRGDARRGGAGRAPHAAAWSRASSLIAASFAVLVRAARAARQARRGRSRGARRLNVGLRLRAGLRARLRDRLPAAQDGPRGRARCAARRRGGMHRRRRALRGDRRLFSERYARAVRATFARPNPLAARRGRDELVRADLLLRGAEREPHVARGAGLLDGGLHDAAAWAGSSCGGARRSRASRSSLAAVHRASPARRS